MVFIHDEIRGALDQSGFYEESYKGSVRQGRWVTHHRAFLVMPDQPDLVLVYEAQHPNECKHLISYSYTMVDRKTGRNKGRMDCLKNVELRASQYAPNHVHQAEFGGNLEDIKNGHVSIKSQLYVDDTVMPAEADVNFMLNCQRLLKEAKAESAKTVTPSPSFFQAIKGIFSNRL